MRIWSKGKAVWFILSIIFTYLVDLFTVSPRVTSGNGNLGLVFVVAALAVFLLFAKRLWRDLGELEKSPSWKKMGIGTLVLLLAFCILEYNFAIHLVNDLGGSPKVESSRIYRYPWLNQYTNTLFINYYTLGIMVALVALIKMIFKKKTMTHE